MQNAMHTLCVVQMCSFLLHSPSPSLLPPTLHPLYSPSCTHLSFSFTFFSVFCLFFFFSRTYFSRTCFACCPYLIWFHVHNMHVQYIECLYKCDCFCCLFGKLFNITLAFVCIESAYVGWWCGNRVHNEYIQSLPPAYAANTSLALSCSPPLLSHFIYVIRHEYSRSKSSHKWYDTEQQR